MSDTVPFTPTGDKMVIDVLDSSTTAGGILLPPGSHGCNVGVVRAIGEGRYDFGVLIPTTVVVGEKVVYLEKFAQEFIIQGKKYTLLEEKNVIATY